MHLSSRGSIGSTKENGTVPNSHLINASELVYLIEFIRNELIKIEYLFQSTLTHAQIDLPNLRLKQIELFEENLFQDELTQLKRFRVET